MDSSILSKVALRVISTMENWEHLVLFGEHCLDNSIGFPAESIST